MLQKAETEYKDRPEISEVKHNQSSYDSSKTSCGRPSQLNLLILVIVMIINFARRCGVLWGRSFARNIKPPKKYLVTEAEEERVLGMAGKIPESEKLDRERQNDQMTEQSLKKSMVSEPKAGFKLLDMLEKVDKKQCRGCGAKFQFDDKTKEGHIDLKRLKPEDTDLKIEELIEKLVMQKANIDAGTDASLHEEPENAAQTNNMRQYTLEDYENDPLGLNSIEEVEALFEEKIVPKEICDRCVLINNGRYQELKEIEVNIESKASLTRNTSRSFCNKHFQEN
jgi:hypothetical protein